MVLGASVYPHILHPTPYTPHPAPYTLHPTPHTLQRCALCHSIATLDQNVEEGGTDLTRAGSVTGPPREGTCSKGRDPWKGLHGPVLKDLDAQDVGVEGGADLLDKVVMQKSIPAQTRRLIPYVGKNKEYKDKFVRKSNFAKRLHKHSL